MRTSLLRVIGVVLWLTLVAPPQAASSQTASVTIVSQDMASFTGKVHTRRDMGMMWYHLRTGTGQTVLIGAVTAFVGARAECLDKAMVSGREVTISGTLTLYDDASGTFNEATVECTGHKQRGVAPAPAQPVTAAPAAPPTSVAPSAPGAGPAEPTGPASTGKALRLNDTLHAEYMQNVTYADADKRLNATWQQVKATVSAAQYGRLLQEQRQWVKRERDAAATRYAASMSEVEAFTKAMQDRITALAKIVAAEPVR